jgi:hypothetical protein
MDTRGPSGRIDEKDTGKRRENALKSELSEEFRGIFRKLAAPGEKNKWCPEEDSNLHALASAST